MSKTAEMWRQGADRPPAEAPFQKAIVLLEQSMQKDDWFSACIADVLQEHAAGNFKTPTDLKQYVERVEADFQRNLQLAREFWRKYRSLVEDTK